MDYARRRGPRSGSKKEWSMPLNVEWYKLYETNSDFNLWFDNLARGSLTTVIEQGPEHYRDLAKRTRRAVERYRSEARKKTQKEIILPEYPKVEIRGKDVVVIWENGSEELWGTESDNMSRGSEEGVELGLKSINYVKSKLAESIDEIVGDLLDVGIPPKYLDRIVNEGYDGIKKLLIKLYYNKIDLERDD